MRAALRSALRSVLRSAALAAAVLVACDKGSTGPEAGDLVLRLATPHADDGALVLTVTGPEIGAVKPAAAGLIVHSRPAGNGVKVAVFGDVAAGPVLRLTVPDVDRVSQYAATVTEAADRANAVRAGVAEYRLTVSR